MKFVKAALLIAVGVKLLSLFGRDVHEWATDFIARHGIDGANRFVGSALAKLEGVGNKQIVAFSAVAFSYSGLLLTEGVGLWMQKRWAEYLTAIATALFIPLELYELYERFTWVRIGILALNGFIVWYLVTRLTDERREQRNDGREISDADTPLVKICGITRPEDAAAAVGSGADLLGFNFYRRSSRYITPKSAGEIISGMPGGVRTVGIFVNETAENICRIANETGIDAVQLHGDEDAEFIARLRAVCPLEVIKAVRLRPGVEAVRTEFPAASALLIDSYAEGVFGGSGKLADWSAAYKMGVAAAKPIFLAGGLTPDNVAEAVRAVRPYAVDVASGVESTPGIKDARKVAAFIRAAKEAI
ncbi:MAG: phosphoribosylanthranilate isomerase [Pyrinomonadaceae bacterium]|nr:phosphoribosylanthranilate isomerase [Pyrinomonadaceae bacterium]